MTPKQKLQKDRAYFKFVLAGLPKPIRLESLSEHERKQWNEILLIRKSLIDEFDFNSNKLGLNIPKHKCYCGKPAKLQVDYYNNGKLEWVCKKHSYND